MLHPHGGLEIHVFYPRHHVFRLQLIWHWQELDLRNVRRTQEIFQSGLAKSVMSRVFPEKKVAGRIFDRILHTLQKILES